MKKLGFAIATVLWLLLVTNLSHAQLTIMNVPSADVMDKGKLYFRGDAFYSTSPMTQFLFNPNFMLGVGHNLEFDLNVNSLSRPGTQIAVTPGFKFAAIKTKSFTGYIGDQLSLPVHEKAFNAGNYLYAAGAYTYKSTRLTGGAWDSQNSTQLGNHAGALLGLEQTVWMSKKTGAMLTPAIDWQSGYGSNGATSFGVMYYPTKRIMLVPSYMVANGTHNGMYMMFVGFNIN